MMTPVVPMSDLPPETTAALIKKYPGFTPQRIIEQNNILPLDPDDFRDTTTMVVGYEVIEGKPILLFKHGHAPEDLLGKVGAYSFLLRWTLMQSIIRDTKSNIFDELTWKALATIPLNPKTQPTIDEFNSYLETLER